MMSEQPPTRSTPVWPVFLVIVLLLLFFAVFLVEFINLSSVDTSGQIIAEDETKAAYSTEVTRLLADADLSQGEALLSKHGCVSCHLGTATDNGLAPNFAGIAERAELQRPPLTAAAYIYESIVYPTVYEVEGYSAQMPITYGDIPDDELGHMMAYLLSDAFTESAP